MRKLLLLILMVGITASLSYGQKTITGSVQDDTGEPLIGATVIEQGTTNGTTTDIDGNFSLKVEDAETAVIEIRYIGFETVTYPTALSDRIDAVLSAGKLLDEVVVTGFGISKDEKALGYAVQQVGGEEIENANTVSVVDALSGKAAGVMVNTSSGAAGASSRVVLRGQTSFNGNNQPLLVVDGVRVNNSESHSERSLGGVAVSNRGMDINPNDIESVSVLKGAGATALYGVEGARGVILITTKKGANKKLTVDVSSNATFQTISNMLGLQETYSQGWSGAWAGPSTSFIPSAVSWGGDMNNLSYDGSDDYKWDKNGQLVDSGDATAAGKAQIYDNVGDFFQQGLILSNNVSVSGGNEYSNFRASVGQTNQEGVVPNNTFARTNFGVSASTKVNRFSLSTGLNFSRSGGTRIQQGSNISGIMLGLLRTPISFDNSNGFGADAVSSPDSYQFSDFSQRNYRAGGGYDNPYWIVNNAQFNDIVNRSFGNLKLGYEIHPWLALGANIGVDFYTDNRKQEFEIGSRNAPGGQVLEDQINYQHYDSYFNVTGGDNIGESFSLSYNLGLNVFESNSKFANITANDLSFPGFVEVANASDVSSSINQSGTKNVGAYGVLDFGFKNWAYLTLTGRNDWLSSLIVPGKPFDGNAISVFYPSASLSLIFSDMFNLPSSSPLSFAKGRVSFAQMGGGPPGAYLTGTVFAVPGPSDGWTSGLTFPFSGTTGYTLSDLTGSESLSPSITSDFEVGLELRFLNNRIGLEGTYYTRNSGNQIIPINISNSTGFTRAVVNSGELATVGTELVLDIAPVRSRNFNWDMRFNFSQLRTTVENLPEGVQNQYLDGFTGTGVFNFAPEEDEEGNITQVYEFGQIFGGAFQRTNDVNEAGSPIYNPDKPWDSEGQLVIDDAGSPDPNSPMYNGNYGKPLEAGNQIIGNPNPDFLLGINNTFSWKGLTLDLLFDIKHGGQMWNGTKGAASFFGRTAITEDRVQPNDDGTSDYHNANYLYEGVLASNGATNNIAIPLDQNWFTGNGGGFGNVAESFIEDASYYRLRYVTLGYDLRKADLPKLPFEKIGLSVTGRNLLILTPYTGVDPETSLVGSGSNGQGLDYFQMPGVRSVSVGLNLTF